MAANGTGIYHWQDNNTGVDLAALTLQLSDIYDNYNNGKKHHRSGKLCSIWQDESIPQLLYEQ